MDKKLSRKLKIGVIALRSLPVVEPQRKGQFGGLETSAWLTAKALATREELSVTLITRYHLPVLKKKVDNVEIVTRFSPLEILRENLSHKISIENDFPWLRIYQFSLSLLWKIPVLTVMKFISRNRSHELYRDRFYSKQKFDALCLFGINLISARAILSVQNLDTKTFLFVQSNSGLQQRFSDEDSVQDEYGERSEIVNFVIENSGNIIAQTPYQQQLLKQNFERDSVVVGNPFDFESWDQRLEQPFSIQGINLKNYVLWIGRADQFHKRPELLLQLARRCPLIPFVMVLNQGSKEVRNEIERTLPENVFLVDHVPFNKMPSLFQKSSVFAFTGTQQHEGFPNVLIQAAASSRPIVSFDYLPDLICQSEGAMVAGSIEEMGQRIESLWKTPEARFELGKRNRNFVEENFGFEEYAQEIVSSMIRQ